MLETCSCHCGSPQESLEDWATVEPCWVRSGIAQVLSVCAVRLWSASGGRSMLPTRQAMIVCRQACPHTSSLTEFVTVSGCAAHDVHIPLVAVLPIQRPWLAPLCTCHSRVSPQQWSSSIYQYFGQCIALSLKFKDPKAPKYTASRKALWLSLSVDHDVADLQAVEVQLVFARGRVPSSFDMPRQRGRSGAHRGHAQDSVALYKSCRAVVGSGSVPLRRPWLCPRFAASMTRCRSFAPKLGLSFHLDGFARFLEEGGVHGTDRHCVQWPRSKQVHRSSPWRMYRTTAYGAGRAASELGGPDRPSEPMASPCWLLMQVGFKFAPVV